MVSLFFQQASLHPPAWTPKLLNLARTPSLLAPVPQSIAQNVPHRREFLRYWGNLLSRYFNPDRRMSPVARVLDNKSLHWMQFHWNSFSTSWLWPDIDLWYKQTRVIRNRNKQGSWNFFKTRTDTKPGISQFMNQYPKPEQRMKPKTSGRNYWFNRDFGLACIHVFFVWKCLFEMLSLLFT